MHTAGESKKLTIEPNARKRKGKQAHKELENEHSCDTGGLQSPQEISIRKETKSEPLSRPHFGHHHRPLAEANDNGIPNQGDVALFIQELDQLTAAPPPQFLLPRTPAQRPRSRNSSTESFKTTEEEPEHIAAAIEAAMKESISDSLQEDHDPTDAENLGLGLDELLDGLPLEDLPSTFFDDITDHIYSSDDEENDEERGALLDLVLAGEYVVV
ncbi:MAG: hypothetical protein Q9193_003436 [Seirophora villosa]